MDKFGKVGKYGEITIEWGGEESRDEVKSSD